VRLPDPCLVVLVGPSGAGKSAWAAAAGQFPAGAVVSSDAMRALVGEGEHDQRAGTDAFSVLDLVVDRRLRRRLLTVVDSLGLDPARRRAYLEAARRHGLPCHAVLFDTPAEVCRARNRERPRAVPARVLAAQLQAFAAAAGAIGGEGFDGVHRAEPVALVPASLLDAPTFASRQREDPMSLHFGLQLPRFEFPGHPATTAGRLAGVAGAAEAAGFRSLWLMDHFRQIPVVGREWEDMLESWTTLAFLAAHTATVTLGTLVTGVTYRNVAHLGKIVATVDVLSGGRAVCGIGAAWFQQEHAAWGWPFPPPGERLDLLEDALQLLPLVWGKGSPSFQGKVVSVPEAMCYPRPLQEHVPVLVGGGGERRTLRLVARYADACNLFGDAAAVRHKLEVLDRHCAEVGRDRAEIEVTHLAPVPAGASAGDLVGRYRELAEAGVQHAIVSFADLATDEPVERFAEVVQAFA
jgi:F420-dependent oxidoreductase-like protein